MPRLDKPPSPEEVDFQLYESVVEGGGHFLVDYIESEPASHELRYMENFFDFKDFEFAAYHAFDREWRRDRFLLMNFSQARKEAAISIGTRLAIGFSVLIPFLL